MKTHLTARLALVASLLLAHAGANAQTSTSPASPAAPAAPTQTNTAKATKAELVARLVQLQQVQVQLAARSIIEQPVNQLLQQAGIAIQQRVPAEGREAAMKDVQAEARKYVDEVTPIMRDSVQRLAAQTMAPLFEEKLNDDELRQLIAIFESPVLRKYEQIGPEVQRQLREKLLADVRGKFEERYRVLDQAVGRRLGLTAGGAPSTNGGATPARAPAAASAPRKP